jgi:hypothetical protein
VDQPPLRAKLKIKKKKKKLGFGPWGRIGHTHGPWGWATPNWLLGVDQPPLTGPSGWFDHPQGPTPNFLGWPATQYGKIGWPATSYYLIYLFYYFLLYIFLKFKYYFIISGTHGKTLALGWKWMV